MNATGYHLHHFGQKKLATIDWKFSILEAVEAAHRPSGSIVKKPNYFGHCMSSMTPRLFSEDTILNPENESY